MKHPAGIFPIILLFISSCSTLNISEIRSLERIPFDSLELRPDRETNNLRIDLIRQQHQEPAGVYDSIVKYSDTPYHPLGFYIGNGIFYDMNENFCLRVDQLLGFNPDNNFELTRVNKPEKNRGIINYKFINDTLTLNYPPKKKVNYSYHRVAIKDSVSYMHNKRLKYTIIENDTCLIYRGKKAKWDVIHKINETQYYRNKRRRAENYQIKANEIILKKEYIVSLTNNNKTIEIKNQRKGNDRILYTIERSKDEIFIFNKHYSGLKIIYAENSISIYQNETLFVRYELKNRSGGHNSFDIGVH